MLCELSGAVLLHAQLLQARNRAHAKAVDTLASTTSNKTQLNGRNDPFRRLPQRHGGCGVLGTMELPEVAIQCPQELLLLLLLPASLSAHSFRWCGGGHPIAHSRRTDSKTRNCEQARADCIERLPL